jgi:cold-inducible RNA-binding protein
MGKVPRLRAARLARAACAAVLAAVVGMASGGSPAYAAWLPRSWLKASCMDLSAPAGGGFRLVLARTVRRSATALWAPWQRGVGTCLRTAGSGQGESTGPREGARWSVRRGGGSGPGGPRPGGLRTMSVHADNRVFLPRLPEGVTDEELRSHFARFGEISDVYIPVHPATGKPKGLAFVTFSSSEHAAAALEQAQQEINGEACEVVKAVPRPDRRGGGDPMRGDPEVAETEATADTFRAQGVRETRGRGAMGRGMMGREGHMIPARESPFFIQLQATRDLSAALDLQRLELDRHRQLGTGTQRDARSAHAFQILSDISILSAERGSCSTADLEEMLARAKAYQVPLRRPFFFALLKTAAMLVLRSRAKPELIETLLAEMQAQSISPDQATTSVLVDLVTSTADRGKARAQDVWWVLDHVGIQALSPRIWMPLMKVLAAAAKHGHASSADAIALVQRARDFFGRRGACPSVFFFNSAMNVLVLEQRHRSGGVPPGMRVRPGTTTVQAPTPATQRKDGKSISPWEILAFMDEVGELADEVTFNSALSFYVPSAGGDTRDEARRQALALMSEMRKRNSAASTTTYNIVLQVLAFSSLDGAAPDEALSHVFSSPPAPRPADRRRENRLVSALMLVDEMMIRMRKIGVTPGRKSSEALV